MELNKKIVNFESMNENTKLTLAEALLYTKGLAGGYGGDFPLSTASKDSIYRVPATNKFYVCTENYNGSQISAPNSNFVELSVWKNHDRLNNLITMEILTSTEYSPLGEWNEFIFYTNTDNIIAIIPFDKPGIFPEYISLGKNYIRSGVSPENKEQSVKILRLKK